MDILSKIQTELNAPKNQRNNFGNYNYRSCEDILEGLKPLLKDTGTSIILSDDIKMIGDRIYVVATAKLVTMRMLDLLDGKKDSIILIGESTAFAREPLQQKGMNEAQITGSASSYARKYALNGLFAIDDNKDSDTDEHQNNANNRPVEKKTPVSLDPKKEVTQVTRNIVMSYIESGKMLETQSNKLLEELKSKKKFANQYLVDELIKEYGSLNA
jgi:hypothetical protein